MSMKPFRDSFEFMDDSRRQRERFGDNESDSVADDTQSEFIDLTLILRQDRPLSLMVSRPEQLRSETWISLPKSLIEYYEIRSPGCVVVRLRESVAREKGLI